MRYYVSWKTTSYYRKDSLKLAARCPASGCWPSCYGWNQFKVTPPWPVGLHSVQETSPNFLRRRATVDGTSQHINLILVSRDRLLSRVTLDVAF